MLKRAFSLMEMLVVLLIVAIIAAASAPMVSKKMASTSVDGIGCLWKILKEDPNSITYNSTAKSGKSVIIGAKQTTETSNSAKKPRLFIRTESKNNPQIELDYKDNETLPLKIAFFDKNTWLSTKKMEKQTNATAIGHEANANSYSIALGAIATALGQNSIAIGDNSGTAGNAVAIGIGAKGNGDGSVALGLGAAGNGANAVALGLGANASNTFATALGYSSEASGSGAIAIGDATASGTSSTALGATATGNYSIAIGVGDDPDTPKKEGDATTESKGPHSIAIGSGATAKNQGDIAIGTGAYTEASEASVSTAVGYKARATGSGSAYGFVAKAEGIATVAIGQESGAKGDRATAVGFFAQAVGTNSTAIGYQAKVYSQYSDSTAIGYNATTTASNQIALGTANTTVYIPGNLVVDGDVVLARKHGKRVYVRIPRKDNEKEDVYPLMRPTSLDDDYDVYVYDDHKVATSVLVSDAFPLGISDRRLKNVGEAFTAGLEEIKKLEVFNYVYKKDSTKTPRVGVMAQDLMKIFPNAVVKGDDGFYRIRMEDMFYALVNAVKELDRKIDLLVEKQKKIDELEKRVDTLEKRLAKLEKQKA